MQDRLQTKGVSKWLPSARLPTALPWHLSEEQLLLSGRALAGLRLPRGLRLLLVTLDGLLLHLHTRQGMCLLLPREPVQVGLIQQGLMLPELFLRLLGVALWLPWWLAWLGDDLQRRGTR